MQSGFRVVRSRATIAPYLPDFKVCHPVVRLRLLNTIWPDDFHTVQASVEIPFGSHKQFGRDAVLLEPNGLVSLKSPGHAGDLHALPLIEVVGTSSGWKTWQGGRGQDLVPQIFVDSFGAAINMEVRGNGVALVSEALAHSALASSQLVMAHDRIAPSPKGYFVRADPENATAQVFRDWVLAL